jgi:hypothetical protein
VNRRARQNKAPILRLPMINTSVVTRMVFRFYGANQASISATNIFSLLAMNLNNSTAFASLIASFRIARVTLMGVSGTSIQTCSLLWKATQLGKSVFLTDTSVSTAAPPYLTSAPPKDSTASFWHENQSDSIALFILNPSSEEGGASPVTVVDLHLDITLMNQYSILITGSGTGTAGQVYYGYLDGPGSSPAYQPVGGLPYH